MHRPPLVSVVAAILDEEVHIGRLLAQLRTQTYPPDRLEVVLADGGSGDRTREIVRAEAAGWSALRLIDNPERSTSTGLNRAIGAAGGDVILLVGGHSEIPADFVERSVEALLLSGAAVVGGRVVSRGRSLRGRAIATALRAPIGVGANDFRTGRPSAGETDTVAFGAYRRDVFERFGLFDPMMIGAEDGELNYRLRHGGARIWYDPRITSVYYGRETLRGLATQYFRYGRGKGWIMRRYRSVPSARQLAPPALLVGLAGCSALAVISRTGRWLLAGTTGAYVGALVVGVARERPPKEEAPLVVIACAVMHLAYGAGMLRGLAGSPPPGSG